MTGRQRGFSEEFLALSREEKLARLTAGGVVDEDSLPPEVREQIELATQQVEERWKGRRPKPYVIDRRTPRQAS